jgi:hypothetical protein
VVMLTCSYGMDEFIVHLLGSSKMAGYFSFNDMRISSFILRHEVERKSLVLWNCLLACLKIKFDPTTGMDLRI